MMPAQYNTLTHGSARRGRTFRIAAFAAAALIGAMGTAVLAQSAALIGKVTSNEEGAMEGVLVSAQKTGSTISITVVSDAEGRFSFPAAILSQGEYALRIRAAGFDLEGAPKASISAQKTAQADLKLKKTRDLAAQMTNSNWMASVPGAARQKTALLNCVNCHTLERVMRSSHTSEQFLKIVLPRMQGYVNQSIPEAPQLRKGERLLEERGDQRVQVYKELGDYLAQINLSTGPQWGYALKPAPRPKGRATRVIVTEYDLPHKVIQPHNVILDDKGVVWYSSFGEQKIGRLDPSTGAVNEFPVNISKPEFPTGVLALRTDRAGELWIGNMYQASIARFDRKTEKFQTYGPAPKDNLPSTQLNMVAAMNSHVDGKVWTQNNGFAGVHRLDLATGKMETWAPFKEAKEPHNIYDVISDSKNNAFFTDFRQRHIGRIDAKTGEVKLFATPTEGSSPRRGNMDAQDRLWFGEYRGHRIGMLDTKTEKFREWLVPTPYSAPYDVVLDKNDNAWTGSMTSDRIARLDTKTDAFTEYLLPRSTNIRRVFVDNSTSPVAFWLATTTARL